MDKLHETPHRYRHTGQIITFEQEIELRQSVTLLRNKIEENETYYDGLVRIISEMNQKEINDIIQAEK